MPIYKGHTKEKESYLILGVLLLKMSILRSKKCLTPGKLSEELRKLSEELRN